MKLSFILLLSSITFTGCTTSSQFLPYDSYYIGTMAPRCMETYIEDFFVKDTKGLIHVGGNGRRGDVSNDKDIKGWEMMRVAAVANMPAGFNPPVEIYVKWESIIEQKVYEAKVKIPESIGKLMKEPIPVCYKEDHPNYKSLGKEIKYYSKFTVGVAPGGIVTVWLGTICEEETAPTHLITRAVGNIYPNGPKFYDNRSNGYSKPSSEALDCIKKHGGIPYGSW